MEAGKFLNLFEAKLEDAVIAGNRYTEFEKMYALAQALGAEYVTTLTDMEREPQVRQSFVPSSFRR